MKSVTGYLVTIPDGKQMDVWSSVASYSNWLDGRTSRNDSARVTWYVMVADHDEHFLAAAREAGVTVERLEGSGESESYVLLVGEPGTGWGR
jgi:poly(3-hydroxyalkanoate) synthetase